MLAPETCFKANQGKIGEVFIWSETSFHAVEYGVAQVPYILGFQSIKE